ncbi:hypothetical protein [Elizabethkingia meningoseptica]|uniref:hypothetical protein n=2 Tax=Elizabethkingia meningoseptica TaxID=238 RepID=UPI00162ADB7B|nr:hypothetical protein [Elizabethkingia meningoseptica]MBG0514103.1 hypothetical protein [Elizabethkingia meningoseptica]MDE5433019.1 hypothetical protein [Elizabethkingia meningoseptica]
MHKFWYHSPVRFYRSLSDLEDMTNPQNTQYFGTRRSYPLEVNEFHRFQIPDVDNLVETSDLVLWIVNDRNEFVVPAQFGIDNGKLRRVTLKSFEWYTGHFEIRDNVGNKLFFSNCVRFLDSTDNYGRKFIRMATKHLYNRNLFNYETYYDWTITNLPARCTGDIDVDVDLNTTRSGGISNLRNRDSYIDEIVSYEFESDGNGNILNFIKVHAANNLFFIDGTQRTMKDKMDRSDFAMSGILKFTNQKDKNGLNITINEDDIFKDVFLYVIADNDNRPIEFKDNVLIQVNNE